MPLPSNLSVRELLEREGSDKGKLYGSLYDVLLRPQRETTRCVVEVGIGTLMPDAPATMFGWAAEHYRPGGSLRAWRDFFPNAEIHGIDIAPDTQFRGEQRIHTHLCDSQDAEKTAVLLARIQPPPDLVIDDALHDVDAQTQTLLNFLPSLPDGGLYVVEDVAAEDVPLILPELEHIRPGCHSFTYLVSHPWPPPGGAIVVRA